MTSLNQRLRSLRKQSGLTVREFAVRIGKSPGYVSRIEGKSEIPSAELLCQIANVYEIPAEELLELAKSKQIADVKKTIEEKQASALALFRKGKK